MTIEEVRAWFVGRGWGIAAGQQLFYERLATILEPGESIEFAVQLNCENAIGYAVLTDRRLVHVGNNIMTGMAIQTVPRADIQGASLGGLVLAKLTIKHTGGTITFKGGKPQAKQLVAALGY